MVHMHFGSMVFGIAEAYSVAQACDARNDDSSSADWLIKIFL